MPQDDKTELFYWVDEYDQELGSITRKEAHSGGRKIHRAVTVLVIDEEKILLQRRSSTKDTYPNYWTFSASGHVTYGQTYKEAAIRELQEEIGIIAKDLLEVRKSYFENSREREVEKTYTYTYANDIFILDQTEVSGVKWIEIDRLGEFAKKNRLTPAAKQIFHEIFGVIFH